MKILHVVPGLGDGGAEAVLFGLVARLSNFEHCIICLGPSGKYERMLNDVGAKVVVVNLKFTWSAIGRLSATRHMVGDFRPEVVQGWLYHGNLAASILTLGFRRTRLFWSLHHTNLVKGIDPWHTRLVSKIGSFFSYLLPRKIVCVAETTRKLHEMCGYDPRKLELIPNGHDVELYSPNDIVRDQFRTSMKILPDVFVFGTAARYAPQKDIPNLLNAISHLCASRDDFVYFLFGEGMTVENKSLADLVFDLGISSKVRLMGPQVSMHQIYPGLDAYVSSSAFGEALPNVICEAMACGVPCVTTDVGDSGEIVRGTGLKVQPSNAVALGDAMEVMMRLSDDGEGWRVRRKNCRARIVKDFSLEKSARAYSDLWCGDN